MNTPLIIFALFFVAPQLQSMDRGDNPPTSGLPMSPSSWRSSSLPVINENGHFFADHSPMQQAKLLKKEPKSLLEKSDTQHLLDELSCPSPSTENIENLLTKIVANLSTGAYNLVDYARLAAVFKRCHEKDIAIPAHFLTTIQEYFTNSESDKQEQFGAKVEIELTRRTHVISIQQAIQNLQAPENQENDDDEQDFLFIMEDTTTPIKKLITTKNNEPHETAIEQVRAQIKQSERAVRTAFATQNPS